MIGGVNVLHNRLARGLAGETALRRGQERESGRRMVEQLNASNMVSSRPTTSAGSVSASYSYEQFFVLFGATRR